MGVVVVSGTFFGPGRPNPSHTGAVGRGALRFRLRVMALSHVGLIWIIIALVLQVLCAEGT
jgi:hypothetical protein